MAKMPPPGAKPSLMIAVGTAKPKGEDTPPKPPADPTEDPTEPDDDDDKLAPEKAMVIRGDQHCSNCSNYHAEDGSCEKVQGQMSPDDACVVFFSGMSDEEPDADDMGGAPAGGPMGQGMGQSS